MRLIDADALMEKYCDPTHCDTNLIKECKIDPLCATMMWINEAPTIEAEPVEHGKWEWKDLRGDGFLTLCCSECLETEGVSEHHKYCHTCGARMDGE